MEMPGSRPVYNAYNVTIPPMGLMVVQGLRESQNNSRPLRQVTVGSTKAILDLDNPVLSLNFGASIQQNAGGTGIFDWRFPVEVAVEDDSATDLLISKYGNDKLVEIDRGAPGHPGDYREIYAVFRNLGRTASGYRLAQRIMDPTWFIELREGSSKGAAAVGAIGTPVSGDFGEFITFYNPFARVGSGKKAVVKLVAGTFLIVSAGC